MKQRFTTQRRSQLVQMVVNEGSISITDAANAGMFRLKLYEKISFTLMLRE